MLIEVFIATAFEGTYPTAVFMHHYETPNWILLGCGVILFGFVLAVLAIKLLLRQQVRDCFVGFRCPMCPGD